MYLLVVMVLCDGLPLRLVLNLPEHVADQHGPPEAAVVVLPGQVQLVQREVEHAGACRPVAGSARPIPLGRQAVGVVTQRPPGPAGHPSCRGGLRADAERGRDWRAAVHLCGEERKVQVLWNCSH